MGTTVCVGKASYPHINVAATGRNIQALMNLHGLTVRDVKDYLGLGAPQSVYRWYWGKSLPSTDHLFALSKLFAVPMDSILVEQDWDAKYQPAENTCQTASARYDLGSKGNDKLSSVLITYHYIAFGECTTTVSTSLLQPPLTKTRPKSWTSASSLN